MNNVHATAMKEFYTAFSKGDHDAALKVCADSFSFQVPGEGKLAGKYTRANFAELGMKLRELSGGTFNHEVHDILASDLHATVLGTYKLVRDGKTVELRTVHVWRFEGGKPLAGYEYPRDLYQYDAIWG